MYIDINIIHYVHGHGQTFIIFIAIFYHLLAASRTLIPIAYLFNSMMWHWQTQAFGLLVAFLAAVPHQHNLPSLTAIAHNNKIVC